MQGRGDLLDEKVGSILTDLGYTKTRHHDKYVGGGEFGFISSRKTSNPFGAKRCIEDVWRASSILA